MRTLSPATPVLLAALAIATGLPWAGAPLLALPGDRNAVLGRTREGFDIMVQDFEGLTNLDHVSFFSGADLREADFRGKSLRHANLRGTDCTRADFSGVDLRTTLLGGAVLADCVWDGALLLPEDAKAIQAGGALPEGLRIETREGGAGALDLMLAEAQAAPSPAPAPAGPGLPAWAADAGQPGEGLDGVGEAAGTAPPALASWEEASAGSGWTAGLDGFSGGQEAGPAFRQDGSGPLSAAWAPGAAGEGLDGLGAAAPLEDGHGIEGYP